MSEVIAVRPLSIGGKSYQPGDTVKGLSPEKVAQLVAQRQLRSADEGSRQYVALRRFSIGGKTIEVGQKIKIKSISQGKLSQLLEQRYLEPLAS